MRDLEAVRPLVYANRRYQVGDYFTTRTDSEARVMIASKKAKERGETEAPKVDPKPAAKPKAPRKRAAATSQPKPRKEAK